MSEDDHIHKKKDVELSFEGEIDKPALSDNEARYSDSNLNFEDSESEEVSIDDDTEFVDLMDDEELSSLDDADIYDDSFLNEGDDETLDQTFQTKSKSSFKGTSVFLIVALLVGLALYFVYQFVGLENIKLPFGNGSNVIQAQDMNRNNAPRNSEMDLSEIELGFNNLPQPSTTLNDEDDFVPEEVLTRNSSNNTAPESGQLERELEDSIDILDEMENATEDLQQTNQITDVAPPQFPTEQSESDVVTPNVSNVPSNKRVAANQVRSQVDNRSTIEKSALTINEPQRVHGPSTALAEDAYFDSDLQIPSAQVGGATGPRKLNPKLEPASKYIVVQSIIRAESLDSELAAARRALSMEHYDFALEMYNKLYIKNPRDQRILMGLAVAQQKLGQSSSAINTYEKILDINPDNTDALVNLLGLLNEEYPAVAARRLMDLQIRVPDNAKVLAQLGFIYAQQEQYDEALKYLKNAVTLEPSVAKHHYNIAIVSDRARIYNQAISSYQKALELDALSEKSMLPRETIYDRLSYLRHR